MKVRHAFGSLIFVVTLIFASGLALAQFEPRNPVCIAPADPGGGWDFTCRNIATLLSELGVVRGQVLPRT